MIKSHVFPYPKTRVVVAMTEQATAANENIEDNSFGEKMDAVARKCGNPKRFCPAECFTDRRQELGNWSSTPN